MKQQFSFFELAVYLECSLYDCVFDVLKLHKLCNETFVENAQVVQLHIIYKNGTCYDVSVGSILASEWFEERKNTEYERFEFE